MPHVQSNTRTSLLVDWSHGRRQRRQPRPGCCGFACRGSGGRAPALDPQHDPRIAPNQAQRIINKRRTAAVSKFKQKVAVLVSNLAPTQHTCLACCCLTAGHRASCLHPYSPAQQLVVTSTCVASTASAFRINNDPRATPRPVIGDRQVCAMHQTCLCADECVLLLLLPCTGCCCSGCRVHAASRCVP